MVEYDLEKEKDRFKSLLESAQDELVEAMEKLDFLTHRIRKLQEDIVHLAALCGEAVEDPLKDWGLTDAIRYVIGKARPQALSAVGVKNALVADGYDISEYSNVMASIHQVIKRLLKKGEIVRPALQPPGEEKVYAWGKGMPPPPPLPERMKKRVISKAPPPLTSSR
jgi:hypothetical protein